jgi:hypothetical protein
MATCYICYDLPKCIPMDLRCIIVDYLVYDVKTIKEIFEIIKQLTNCNMYNYIVENDESSLTFKYNYLPDNYSYTKFVKEIENKLNNVPKYYFPYLEIYERNFYDKLLCDIIADDVNFDNAVIKFCDFEVEDTYLETYVTNRDVLIPLAIILEKLAEHAKIRSYNPEEKHPCISNDILLYVQNLLFKR